MEKKELIIEAAAADPQRSNALIKRYCRDECCDEQETRIIYALVWHYRDIIQNPTNSEQKKKTILDAAAQLEGIVGLHTICNVIVKGYAGLIPASTIRTVLPATYKTEYRVENAKKRYNQSTSNGEEDLAQGRLKEGVQRKVLIAHEPSEGAQDPAVGNRETVDSPAVVIKKNSEISGVVTMSDYADKVLKL